MSSTPFDSARLKFFQELLAAPGLSGFEEAPRRVWREAVEGHADEVFTDPHGNCVATRRGTKEGLSIALVAHIDEIGLLVRWISETGLLHVKNVGRPDHHVLQGERVTLLGPNGEVPGVIGRVAWHIQTEEMRKKGPEDFHELWIDIGVDSRAEAEALAPVGTPVIYGPREGYTNLQGRRFTARNIDNRMGCFAVAEAFRRISALPERIPATVHAVASVQEEISAVGAQTISYRLKPTAALCVDVLHDTTSPGLDRRRVGEYALGRGPGIFVGTRSSNPLTKNLMEVARRRSIPYQVDVETGRAMYDLDQITEAGAGVPCAILGIPLRYMHTAAEVGDWTDLELLTDWIEGFLRDLPETADFTPE